MPRGKKGKGTATATTATDATVSAVSVSEPGMTETPITSDVKPDSPQQENEDRTESRRGRFRSWVVDPNHGYSMMTDEINRLLVLQFDEKPQPDILDAIKSAGFRYKPEHDGLKNVWVRVNDFRGRHEVELIEKRIRSVSAGQEPAF